MLRFEDILLGSLLIKDDSFRVLPGPVWYRKEDIFLVLVEA